MIERKDLKHFKSLNYPIIVEKDKFEGEEFYIAYSRELGKKSCYGVGKSHEEAIKSFIKDKDEFIELLYKKDKPIPEPIIS